MICFKLCIQFCALTTVSEQPTTYKHRTPKQAVHVLLWLHQVCLQKFVFFSLYWNCIHYIKNYGTQKNIITFSGNKCFFTLIILFNFVWNVIFISTQRIMTILGKYFYAIILRCMTGWNFTPFMVDYITGRVRSIHQMAKQRNVSACALFWQSWNESNSQE